MTIPTVSDTGFPMLPCPRCGKPVEDPDGFGVLVHIKPTHPDGCGYCSHPSRSENANGQMVCNFCGDMRGKEVMYDGPYMTGLFTRGFQAENADYIMIRDRHSGKLSVYYVAVLTSGDPLIIGRELTSDECMKLIQRFDNAAQGYCGSREHASRILMEIGHDRPQ